MNVYIIVAEDGYTYEHGPATICGAYSTYDAAIQAACNIVENVRAEEAAALDEGETLEDMIATGRGRRCITLEQLLPDSRDFTVEIWEEKVDNPS